MICMSLFGSYGRNGNMLFQLAACLNWAIENNSKVIVPSWIGDEIISISDSKNYQSIPINTTGNIWKFITYISPLTIRYDGNRYSEFKFVNNKNYVGYFQSLEFFKAHEKAIRELYKPKGFFLEILNKYTNIIEHKVAIHVRRGDYLANSLLYPICGENYFFEAITLFPSQSFVVFSDDLEWAKRTFKGERFIFSDDVYDPVDIYNFLEEIDKSYCFNDIMSWFDMYLMSRCAGNIISNSSFSWWSAFLNENKKVVYPINWINAEKLTYEFVLENMIPEGWNAK